MKKILKFLAVLVFSIFLINGTASAQEVQKLPGYKADLSQTSVSGMSSGAFLTSQLHVAYSDKFSGAGIVAGGPFDCVSSFGAVEGDYLGGSISTCMTPLTAYVAPDGKGLYKTAQKLASANKIADVNNLKNDKLYIFSGTADGVVKTLVVDQVDAFYKAAGVDPKNIKYIKSVNAGHALIVDHDAVPCSNTSTPFINDCGFMQSHDILRQIYGNLNPPADTLSGKIIAFDQTEFIKSPTSSMSKVAYAYVPKACETESCKVHVVLHGCLQGATVIGDTYYATTGYNEIADTNKIIALYPQVQPSKTNPINPLGCWDYWGYSGSDFYNRNSPQMKAIVAMVERLGEPRSN